MGTTGRCWGRASVRRCFFVEWAVVAALCVVGCTYWIQGGITTSGGGFKGRDVQGREWSIQSLPTSQPVSVTVKTTVIEPNTPPE